MAAVPEQQPPFALKPFIAHAQAASRAPCVVELFLDDADKRQLFGVPEGVIALPTAGPPNAFVQAVELDRAGRHKDAENIYLELLNAHFDNAVLHAALGMNYATTARSGIAHRLLQYALANHTRLPDDFKALGIEAKIEAPTDFEKFVALKHSEILNAIGTCYKNENVTQTAREYFDRAQALVPPNADIQNNLGTLWINEGKPADALRILNGAIALKANHAQAHWNRSLALLELGKFAEGWAEYDWGLTAKVRMDRSYHHPESPPIPFWTGEKGKKIVVFGEQGIGDELLFMSCLPDLLRDSELVVVDCHKKLQRLLSSSFPSVLFYPTREDEKITWAVLPDRTSRYGFDNKIAAGSLPRYYRNNPIDFPGTAFLKPTDAVVERWRAKVAELPRRPTVGISWIGGHKRTRQEVRSIPLAALEPILKAPVNWVSLQYTPCEDEIAAFTQRTGIHIHHWPDAVYSADYNDTAGLVASLDLVVTVATSVLHLAGGLGVPCWVMTASRAAWREYVTGGWNTDGKFEPGDGDGNPWYRSLTMFRQEQGTTEWAPVIAEVAAALTAALPSLPNAPEK